MDHAAGSRRGEYCTRIRDCRLVDTGGTVAVQKSGGLPGLRPEFILRFQFPAEQMFDSACKNVSQSSLERA